MAKVKGKTTEVLTVRPGAWQLRCGAIYAMIVLEAGHSAHVLGQEVWVPMCWLTALCSRRCPLVHAAAVLVQHAACSVAACFLGRLFDCKGRLVGGSGALLPQPLCLTTYVNCICSSIWRRQASLFFVSSSQYFLRRCS